MNEAPGTGPPQDLIRHGTPAFRRANLGLFAAGVATFGLLYCVQPLMPEFSRQFGVGAAQSALSLSLPSATIAIAMLFAGSVSDALGRKALMSVSLVCSTLVVLLSAAAPGWAPFLVLRALLGLTLSGVPAVAMAYLTEEMHPDSMGLGMGLYIGGNAAGGLGGRLIAGVLTGYFGWRAGIAAVGVIGGLAAGVFVRSLPASRHFVARPLRLASSMQGFTALFRDPALPWLFAAGFVLLGSIVTVYNYAGYRLMAAPYGLSQAAVGMLFSIYLVGIFSSSWIGHVASRLGRRKVLWTMFVTMLAGLRIHGAQIGRSDRGRNRHHHVRLLRGPFHRQQLGRPPRGQRQGPGVLDIPLHLLHGVERCRSRGRIVLCRWRMERRRGLRGSADGRRVVDLMAAVPCAAAAEGAV